MYIIRVVSAARHGACTTSRSSTDQRFASVKASWARTVKKRKTEDYIEIESAVEISDIPDLTSRLRNLEEIARHDYEIQSLTAWSSHGWVFNPAAELASQLLQVLQNYNENKPAKGPHPWRPPRRTL